MHAYISVADAAGCTRRRGQGAKGSGCGSGWDGASSGQTELHVDATGGAQGWVGCHGRDITAGNYPQDMVQQERNCIWAMIEGARERNDWTMIRRDSEGEISLGPPIVPEAARMPRDEEIPLMMPREDAGSPLSPETIRAALTDGDNISEGPDPSVLMSNVHQHLDKFSDGLKKSALLKKSDISNKNLIV